MDLSLRYTGISSAAPPVILVEQFMRAFDRLVKGESFFVYPLDAQSVYIQLKGARLVYKMEKKLMLRLYDNNDNKIEIGVKYSQLKEDIKELLDPIINIYFDLIYVDGKSITMEENYKEYVFLNRLIQDAIISGDKDLFTISEESGIVEVSFTFHYKDRSYRGVIPNAGAMLMDWLNN
jgi:hypothetical protein